MSINWQVRFNNPVWWGQVCIAIISPILAYYGLSFKDLTSWGAVFDVFLAAIKNPYILGLIVVNVFNTINDPTTKGLSDSFRAMAYETPN